MAFSLPVPFRNRTLIRRTVTPAVIEATAVSAAPPGMAAPPPARVGRVVVNKYGTFGAFFRPVGIAVGLVIVGVPAMWATNIFLASEARRAIHESAVVAGNTLVQAPIKRQVAEGEVEFVMRQADGRLVRVIAGKETTDAFINQTLVSLDRDRARIRDRAAAALDQVFAQTFATRDADLNSYADWFFAWGQSWRLLYEAAVGGVQEAFRLGFSQTQVIDAARHGVEDYLLRHYQEFVLKPGVRDPFIVSGIRGVFMDANVEFSIALGQLDDRLQKFVAEKAVFAEPLDPQTVSVKVDWDAEKWRAPRSLAEDRYLEPARTVAVVGASAVVLGPIIERVALPLLARTSASAVASTRTVVAGAAAGSFSPGLGTAVGALIGVAVDWGINAIQGGLQRGDFIKENGAALEATITAWKGTITPEVNRAIDVWFDDLSALVAQSAPVLVANGG
jgi:hypothetical protein